MKFFNSEKDHFSDKKTFSNIEIENVLDDLNPNPEPKVQIY